MAAVVEALGAAAGGPQVAGGARSRVAGLPNTASPRAVHSRLCRKDKGVDLEFEALRLLYAHQVKAMCRAIGV